MHRSVLPLLLLALAFAPGCEPSSVSCGPGTRLEGRVCVPDSTVDTGGGDAGALGDIGPRTDGRVDAPGADGGTSFMEGDRCPTDAAGNNLLSPACVGDQMIACNGDFVRVTDCTELGERCVTAADGLPRCDGGVYGACDRATSTNQCADEAHALLCSGGYPNASGYLYTIACASFGAGYECLTDATGSGGCYPPGTVPCTVPGSRCMGDAIVTCRDGLEYTVPCGERTPRRGLRRGWRRRAGLCSSVVDALRHPDLPRQLPERHPGRAVRSHDGPRGPLRLRRGNHLQGERQRLRGLRRRRRALVRRRHPRAPLLGSRSHGGL